MTNFDTNLIQYLPHWFRQIAEFQEIMGTEEQQFQSLSQAISLVHDNFFFQTMDEATVTAWEQVVGIKASPSTESLDFRRARLINRISTRPPFTLQFLYDKLDQLLGPGNYELEIDYPNYEIVIETAAEDQAWSGELTITLNTVKPCHMLYVARPAVMTRLTLNESVDLVKLIYNYKLGSWGLGLAPFADEQHQGVIITPEQLSIQQALLNQTASFVEGDVATARVNGNISITALTKSTQNNVVTILYNVLQEQTATVTQIELLDASGNVLTSSGVYVPILGTATFKHTIPVQEASS